MRSRRGPLRSVLALLLIGVVTLVVLCSEPLWWALVTKRVETEQDVPWFPPDSRPGVWIIGEGSLFADDLLGHGVETTLRGWTRVKRWSSPRWAGTSSCGDPGDTAFEYIGPIPHGPETLWYVDSGFKAYETVFDQGRPTRQTHWDSTGKHLWTIGEPFDAFVLLQALRRDRFALRKHHLDQTEPSAPWLNAEPD